MRRGGRFGKYGDSKRKKRLQEARSRQKIDKKQTFKTYKSKNR